MHSNLLLAQYKETLFDVAWLFVTIKPRSRLASQGLSAFYFACKVACEWQTFSDLLSCPSLDFGVLAAEDCCLAACYKPNTQLLIVPLVGPIIHGDFAVISQHSAL